MPIAYRPPPHTGLEILHSDGALLVVTESGEVSRITSGTIVMAGEPEGVA